MGQLSFDGPALRDSAFPGRDRFSGVMLLEWAGSITCAVLRGVTHFGTDIDTETDPKCLTAIEL